MKSMSSRLHYVLGIDAGGTSTRCAIADLSGQIVSMGIGGPGNTNFVTAASARKSLEGAVKKALASMSGRIKAAVVAGPHLPKETSGIVSQLTGADKVLMIDEFSAFLTAGIGHSGGCGVVLMAGTGSFCKGRNHSGQEKYSGGWGPLIGDEGSGYDIGREALCAVARASDGRGNRTLLTDILLAHARLTDLGELRRLLYRPPIRRHQVAALAACVSEAAAKGDEVAGDILVTAGRRLAALAAPVVNSLYEEGEVFPVVLSGGVLRGEPRVAAVAREEIRRVRPRADVFVSPLEPMAGTLILGLESIGAQTGPKTIEKLAGLNGSLKTGSKK
jgi:N-acetylglucosamine kinase-like BadF-type ATPase